MGAPCVPPAVITGLGCVSPFGVGGRALIARSLQAPATAIRPLTNFSTAGLSSRLGAEVSPSLLPVTDEARRWSRLSQMTVLACRAAVADAALVAPDHLCQAGLVVGSGCGDLCSTEAFSVGFLRRGPTGLSPLLFPNTVMNAMAGTASIALGLKGPMVTVNQSDAAGELAVVRALALLQAGRASVVLACGVDEMFPLLYETLAEYGVLSPRGQGDEACRPFDVRHNGPVLGEGATALVLEAPAHAWARGAPILAEICASGWGGSPTRPGRYPTWSPGRQRVLVQALQAAGVAPAAVALAYLSGCGDPQHDVVELDCLAAAFGTESPGVTSVTHLTGDYGGLGTFRVAAASLALAAGIVPTLDYMQQPVRTDVCFVREPVTQPPGLVLVHALARGGTQVALLLGPPHDLSGPRE